jgi:hypothetical protein
MAREPREREQDQKRDRDYERKDSPGPAPTRDSEPLSVTDWDKPPRPGRDKEQREG